MKHFLDEVNNRVLALEEDGSQDHLIETGMTQLSNSEFLDLMMPTASLQNRALRRIINYRDAVLFSNVIAHGRQWQADAKSQQLLTGAIVLASAGGSLPPVWRDAQNQNMPITSIDDLLVIANAIAAQTQSAYAYSWQLKADMDAAVESNDKVALKVIAL